MSDEKQMRKVVLAIALATPFGIIAYGPEQAITNQAHELAECGVYYLIMAECARNTDPESDLADNLENSAGWATENAVELSNFEVTEARVQLAEKDLRSKMENQCSNASILINEYNDVCSQAVQNPEARKQYWLNKE